MLRITSVVRLAAIVVVVGFLLFLPRAEAAESVVLPNGGECLTVGQVYAITITSDSDHTALYYRTDGAQPTHEDSTMIKHPLLQLTWNWTPNSGNISETGRIWVDGHLNNHDSRNTWDQSDADFAVRASCATETPAGAPAAPPPTPSVQSVSTSTALTSTIAISWRSDSYSYTRILYATSSQPTSTSAYSWNYSVDDLRTLRLEHSAPLKGFFPGARYYFRIATGRFPGEERLSDEYSFVTQGLPEIVPPPPAPATSTATPAVPPAPLPVLEPATNTAPPVRFAATLRFGIRGNEVRALQELLRKLPGIYPEGLVTGYFGTLTRKAVQRFQEAQGIASGGDEESTGYGLVGPKTRRKMNGVAQGAPMTYIVRAYGAGFVPPSLTVRLGDTVRWINVDADRVWPASDDHPAHLIYPEFDALRNLTPGEEYSFTFKKTGAWKYHDHWIATRTGTITVE